MTWYEVVCMTLDRSLRSKYITVSPCAGTSQSYTAWQSLTDWCWCTESCMLTLGPCYPSNPQVSEQGSKMSVNPVPPVLPYVHQSSSCSLHCTKKIVGPFIRYSVFRDGISVNLYIGLTDISAIFQISDIGIGLFSTDINIWYWISDIGWG